MKYSNIVHFHKVFTVVIFTLCVPAAGQSQLLVNLTYNNPYELKVNDLYTLQITNSGGRENMKMLIDVTAQGLVYHSETSPFLCDAGSSNYTYNSFQIKQSSYSNASTYEITKNTGLFPAGDYYICYKLINLTTNEEVQNCINYEVTPITPILLLNPSQDNIISTLYPQLMWLAPTPALASNVPYTLRIVERQGKQSCYEAIKRNYEVLKQTDITQTSLIYPMNAMPLENYKTYCWQVITPINRKVDSEVWGFTVKLDSADEDAKVVFFDNYVIPKNAPNTSSINIKDQIRIQLEEDFPVKRLLYDVLNMDQKVVISNDQSLVKNEGGNKFTIDLQQSELLKNRSYYTMKISGDNLKNAHYVFFRFYKRVQ